MLKIIKELDKEYSSLKETNKTIQENNNTCKTFLKIFQKDNKVLEEKYRKLKLRNKTLNAEIGKLNDGVVNNDSEIPHVEFGKNIVKNICGGTSIECSTNIKKLIEEFCSILFYYYSVFSFDN